MSTPEDEVRKKMKSIAEEAAEVARKKQQALEEEAQKAKKPIQDDGPKKPAPETAFKAEKPSSDWEKIVEDFKKKYNKEPEGPAKNILSFPSEKDAMAFFESQATEKQPPREFLMQKLENGKPVDDHVFSCGSGQLFRGGLKDIQTQVAKALEAEKDPQKRAKLESGKELIDQRVAAIEKSTDMRAKMGSMKEQAKTEQTPPQPTDTEGHGHKL
ncbi:TPA: hypothetical protein ACPSKE_001984 [Legionella feeleii]